VVASSLGTLFCIISSPSSEAREGYFSLKKASVSALVEKEFISMNLTFIPKSFRIAIICLAVRSRKVSLPFTLSKDLALSSPIPVPRPPFNFNTTVDANREVSASSAKPSELTRSGAGEIVDSGIMPVFPDTNELKVDSKAEMAEGEMPSASILA
jgi:hypothetical protein